MIEVQQADIFAVPLLDGSVALGQVVEVDATPPGTVLCTLAKLRREVSAPAIPLGLGSLLAIELIGRDALDAGLWRIIGFEQIPQVRQIFSLDARLHDGWDGQPLRETPVVEAFLNACQGLYPWDGFPQTDFFDTWLLAGIARPDAAKSAAAMKD